MSERQGNSSNVPDETVIEMSESYEALELFSIRRLGPVKYYLNFNRIRLEIPLLNDVIQERDCFHMEFTILPFYKQFVLQPEWHHQVIKAVRVTIISSPRDVIFPPVNIGITLLEPGIT